MSITESSLLAVSALAAASASITAARSAREAREERERERLGTGARDNERKAERIAEALAELGQLRANMYTTAALSMQTTMAVAASNAMVAYPIAQARLRVALSAASRPELAECHRVAQMPFAQAGALPVEAALGEVAELFERFHELAAKHEADLHARRERRLGARVRRALRR